MAFEARRADIGLGGAWATARSCARLVEDVPDILVRPQAGARADAREQICWAPGLPGGRAAPSTVRSSLDAPALMWRQRSRSETVPTVDGAFGEDLHRRERLNSFCAVRPDLQARRPHRRAEPISMAPVLRAVEHDRGRHELPDIGPSDGSRLPCICRDFANQIQFWPSSRAGASSAEHRPTAVATLRVDIPHAEGQQIMRSIWPQHRGAARTPVRRLRRNAQCDRYRKVRCRSSSVRRWHGAYLNQARRVETNLSSKEPGAAITANNIPACAIVSSRWPSTTCCCRGACPGGWSLHAWSSEITDGYVDHGATP